MKFILFFCSLICNITFAQDSLQYKVIYSCLPDTAQLRDYPSALERYKFIIKDRAAIEYLYDKGLIEKLEETVTLEMSIDTGVTFISPSSPTHPGIEIHLSYGDMDAELYLSYFKDSTRFAEWKFENCYNGKIIF